MDTPAIDLTPLAPRPSWLEALPEAVVSAHAQRAASRAPIPRVGALAIPAFVVVAAVCWWFGARVQPLPTQSPAWLLAGPQESTLALALEVHP